MGRPAPSPEAEHVFVRHHGTLDLEQLHAQRDLEVTSCSHYDMDGALLTEALVSGPRAGARAVACVPDASVVSVQRPEWVRESILAASGKPGTASDGMLAVYALRASNDELHLVSHPQALCGPLVLDQVAQCLGAWVHF